jgi:hypothetical protein
MHGQQGLQHRLQTLPPVECIVESVKSIAGTEQHAGQPVSFSLATAFWMCLRGMRVASLPLLLRSTNVIRSFFVTTKAMEDAVFFSAK